LKPVRLRGNRSVLVRTARRRPDGFFFRDPRSPPFGGGQGPFIFSHDPLPPVVPSAGSMHPDTDKENKENPLGLLLISPPRPGIVRPHKGLTLRSRAMSTAAGRPSAPASVSAPRGRNANAPAMAPAPPAPSPAPSPSERRWFPWNRVHRSARAPSFVLVVSSSPADGRCEHR